MSGPDSAQSRKFRDAAPNTEKPIPRFNTPSLDSAYRGA